MNLFYCPDILPLSIHTLGKEESQHCIKVLRLKEKDLIHITDGVGNLYTAEIIDANIKACSLKIIDTIKEYGKHNYYLHIAIAPIKNPSRLEWFIEKATEMGIDEITPIISKHSEKENIKRERLEKIIVSAMKQSLKTYKPILNNTTNFETLIANAKEKNKYIGYCQGEDRKKIKDIYSKGESVLIIIGPEGDFSQEEVSFAKENSFEVITMGSERLRTETAGLYATNTIHILNQ